LQEEKDKESQSNGNIANNTQEEEQQQPPHNLGLKTNPKPTKINLSAPRADDEAKDSSHNLMRNFLNKHLTKLKLKDATTNLTKQRACDKN